MVLPNKDCRCSFGLVFTTQVAANLMLPTQASITVYLPQLEISVHKFNMMKHSSDPRPIIDVRMTPVPTPKAVLSDLGKDINEFMCKNINENSKIEEQLSVVGSLVSSNFQCIKTIISEDPTQTQLPGIKEIKGQLVNIKCSDHNCSLSVHATSAQNNKINSLCKECASLISDVNHDTWTAMSFKSLESTTNNTVDVALISLSQFAMGLLTNESVYANYGEISIMYSKKLVECNFPQFSIPLLISVLQHACEHAQAREAYAILATALKQVSKDDVDITERWLLKAACDYFTQSLTPDTSSLPDMNTSLCEILDHLLLTKTTALKLVEMAANFQTSADQAVFQHVLIQLLTVYTKTSSNPVKDINIQGPFEILTGIYDLFTMKENTSVGLSVDKVVHGIWRNPDYCQVAAKAVTDFIPKTKNYSQQHISGSVKIQLTAPVQVLYANEMKVKDQIKKGELTHIKAAFWYLDLLIQDRLVYHPAQEVMCLLKSALHFECAFNTAKILSDRVSLRNAALTCTYDACDLVKRMHPGFRVMTFQLALEIAFRLAVVDKTFPSKKCQDAIMAAGLFNNLVYNRQFTFIHCFPFSDSELFVSQALFFNRVSDMAQREFLKNVMNLKESAFHVTPSLLKHQCFENAISDHMNGRETNESLFKKREVMISSFAREKGLTDEEISNLMTSSSMPRDSEGWLIPNKPLGQHMGIASLKGFCLEYSDHSPTIQLLVEPAEDGNGLLSLDDVFTIMQLEQNEVFPIKFSLDPPSTLERYHPFKQLICHPAKLQNTEYMDTLFQADYLLKFFTTGAEVSSQPPFHLKPTEQGLLKSLPKDVQHILRPTHLRGSSRSTRNRSWIEVEEIQYGEEITEEVATYFIQAVKVVVRSHPLVSGINGRIYDAKHSESGPDAHFAAEFTANYDKIAQHFLVFARLRELAKLQFMMQKIYDDLHTKKQASESVYLAFTSELSRLRSLAPSRKPKKECTWVPATFSLCGKGTGVHSVYGGVSLNPSHKNYYNLPGNNVPDGSSGADWKNAVSKVVSPIWSLETLAGGIYFGVKHQYRVPVDVNETENIVCMTLGKQRDSDSSNVTPSSFSDSNACSSETEISVGPKCLPNDKSSENTNAPEHVQASSVDLCDLSPTSAEPMTDSRENLQAEGQYDYDSNSDAKLKDADTVSDDNADNVTTPDIDSAHDCSKSTINPEDNKSENDEHTKQTATTATVTTLDSFSHFFRQSPLNLAVFGNKMQNLGMLNTTTRGSYTAKFHPNELVQEQIMNVIVLQHIYRTQGLDIHTVSQ